ncbi:single-stranded DNA-binding protein [Actinomyces trachealis]|uniref:single-stranded DNA-binding protein n=1 Tax=Actinomyces trachealis TaxID=2763540 RepID=UPI001892BB02|nr:single-stranded DNA-binding protein [Actinomyces trachealis]
MSRQIDVTVQGIVGTSPVLSRTTGNPFCRFRVAVTPSHRGGSTWIDEPTIWFTAKAWGALAENLSFSLSKGDPVLLTGRFSQESWSGERGAGVSNVINLTSAGHDLSRGESRFGRLVRGSKPEGGETDGAAQDQERASASAQAVDADPAALGQPVSPDQQPENQAGSSVALDQDRTEGEILLEADSQVPSELSDSTWELPVSELEEALT